MTNQGFGAQEAGEARKLGLDPDRLLKLQKVIEEDTEKGLYDGAVFLVARDGIVALHEAVGHSDLGRKRKARADDTFFIMSITKQFTAVRVLMAIEDGKFTLTTPVREVIPEFAIKGKQNITVAHILNHTSGLNTEIPFSLPLDKLGSIEDVVAALSNERVLFRPGTLVTYNAITAYSVLAAMVQRLDEKRRSFRQILAEDVFAPLGMNQTALGLPERLKERIVPVVVRDRTPGLFDPLLLESLTETTGEDTELCAGGAVSTARDVSLLAEMLRQGGALEGKRLLASESVEVATGLMEEGNSRLRHQRLSDMVVACVVD